MSERIIHYYCSAPNEVFDEPYEDLSEESLDIIEGQGGIPCEGGSYPGEWCKKTFKYGWCHWFDEHESRRD